MNVLIIEDDISSRIPLCVTIEKLGHSVISAGNRAGVLKILQDTSIARPQIVVLNWKMAETDGAEICRELRRHLPAQTFYVLALIPRHEKTLPDSCLDLGADDYLVTPWLPRQLQARLDLGARIIRLQNSLADQTTELQETTAKLLNTEMALVERALQEWSDTVDAVSDMIILTDAAMRIMRCNQATARFLRLSFKELIGKSLAEFFGFSLAAATPAPAPAPLHDKSWEGQLTGHPDEWFEITNHQVVLRNNHQSGRHRVHIIKNITTRKQAEASLTLLNTAVEQAADSILITDTDGIVQYVNPAFVNCTGWERHEALGQQLTALQAARLTPGPAIFPGSDNIWQGIYQARKKSGEKYDEEISIAPVRREEGGEILNYVAVCRDVTEKRRLESIAEAVNMMQNVGYIFSGIRHELGNPINSVKTALTVLKRNLNRWGTEQVGIYTERCLTEIGRVEYLLKVLKTFSMHENPKMEALPLTPLMRDFIALIEGDLQQRGVEIRFAAPDNIGKVWCDPRALHQVLLNLITNAADALDQRPEARITISLTKAKKRIYVCVADNGHGMSNSQVENLFKPFYTSKTNGTGLGLVIVKKMITGMSGTIHIESRLEQGTKVHFTLEAAN